MKAEKEDILKNEMNAGLSEIFNHIEGMSEILQVNFDKFTQALQERQDEIIKDIKY